jgi:hypothetical protein
MTLKDGGDRFAAWLLYVPAVLLLILSLRVVTGSLADAVAVVVAVTAAGSARGCC